VPRLHLLYSPPEPVASPGDDCAISLYDNGTDWGVRINAADVALGGTAGVICCNGGGNIASRIILNTGASSLRTLRFGAGTWTNSNTAETILPHDNTLIEGHGWDTILQEPPGDQPLGPPTITSISASSTGGTLATGTYYYKRTSLDGFGGGESTPSAEVSVAVTGPTGSVTITYPFLNGAINDRFYRGTSSGGENVYFRQPNGSTTWTDTGAAGTAGTPPSVNTAKLSQPLSWFLMRPLNAAGQRTNISMRNIQLLGMPGKIPNASQATVNTGLLNGGTYQNIWFNKTTAIGITIGETNNASNVCQDIVMRGCKMTNVGGGVPPDFPGGGGVSCAIVNGNRITIDGNTFIDALGNTIIDLEPNTANDPITNIWITNNYISQEGTTGTVESFCFAFVTHAVIGAYGPILFQGNTLRDSIVETPPGSGKWFPGSGLNSILLNLDGVSGSGKITIDNNDLRGCYSNCLVIQALNDNTITNNHFFMGGDITVVGTNNTISGNYVSAANDQGDGTINSTIRELAGGDFNTLKNNQVNIAEVIVGTHSTVSGETIVSRPSYP